MFQRFEKHYGINRRSSQPAVSGELATPPGASKLIADFGSVSVHHGLYRVHSAADVSDWTQIVTSMFPQFAGHIYCFGADWLGRQLAIDMTRKNPDGEPLTLMLDSGAGEVLEIPATLAEFHNAEIIDYAEEALALGFFEKWRKIEPRELEPGECAGYKVPLFLSGKDRVDNLKRIDARVYWEIHTQLFRQCESLPDGTKIGRIKIQ